MIGTGAIKWEISTI